MRKYPTDPFLIVSLGLKPPSRLRNLRAASTSLVLGLGAHLLVKRLLSILHWDACVVDATHTQELSGCFVGCLIFWFSEHYGLTSQASLIFNSALQVLLRLIVDSIIFSDTEFLQWAFLGVCLCGTCTLSFDHPVVWIPTPRRKDSQLPPNFNISPAPYTVLRASITSPESTTPLCVACGDPVQGPLLSLACKHDYDVDCLLDMFLANLSSQLFPPQCCKTTVPLSLIEPFVSEKLSAMMREKQRELSTPDRLYCSNPTCSTFLGARQRHAPSSSSSIPTTSSIICPSCSKHTCARCGAAGHRPSQRCKLDKALKKALELGQAQGWQRCPQCRTVVERTVGCSHISCPCGAHFCYGCGELMSACVCRNERKRHKKLKGYLTRDEPAINLGTKRGAPIAALANICRKSLNGLKGIVGNRKRR